MGARRETTVEHSRSTSPTSYRAVIANDPVEIDSKKFQNIILVILPGHEGRLPVLARVRQHLAQQSCATAVLVPLEDQERSAWAKPVCGDANYINYNGNLVDFDIAVDRINKWLDTTNKTLVGIVCYDEFGLGLHADLVEHFDLPGTRPSLINVIRYKNVFRKACDDFGLATVKNAVCTPQLVAKIATGAIEWKFPTIIKPLSGAGSWCVMKVNSAEELQQTFGKLNAEFLASDYTTAIKGEGFVLEEFFQGQEVDIDGYIENGLIKFSIISDNRPALPPGMAEVGGTYPSVLSPNKIDALNAMTKKVIAAIEAEAHNTMVSTNKRARNDPMDRLHGVFCLEAIVNDDGVCFPIEYTGRVSGAEAAACVEAVTGHWLPSVAVNLALNVPLTTITDPSHAYSVSMNIHLTESGMLTKLSDTKLRKLCNSDPELKKATVQVVLLVAKLNKQVLPVWNAQGCLGWVAGGGPTQEKARENLELILTHLEVEVDNKRVDVVCPE